MNQINFSDLKLIEPLERSLQRKNYISPSPIQAKAIPEILNGKDVLATAQTGTGKTAAFALPILQKLQLNERTFAAKRRARCLVLTPTRELAVQIDESFKLYGQFLKLSHAVVYGGVSHVKQIRSVSQGVDVLVATPGRLLDLINQKHIRLDAVEILVLDEADRMLDMGFIHDVKKIVSMIPKERQTLLFSATMPKEVAQLANSILSNPVEISVSPQNSSADDIDDHVLFVEKGNKPSLLCDILQDDKVQRTIVFTRTKHGANKIAKQLNARKITAEAIHGNKTQNARQRALKEFSSGSVKVLVATDLASRGIDVSGISHVINYEMPNEAESYVHRIGRTARGGKSGVAFSFCDKEEMGELNDIEKLLKRSIDVLVDHTHHCSTTASEYAGKDNHKKLNKRGGRGGPGAGGSGRGGQNRLGAKGRRRGPQGSGGQRSGGGGQGSGGPRRSQSRPKSRQSRASA